jgi:hypothetical protein
MNLVAELRLAETLHGAQAQEAYALFVSNHCNGVKPYRVPGCDTVLRLAHYLYHGRTIEGAAAREYLYRWNLALGRPREDQSSCKPWLIFDAPHTIGL